MASIVPVRRFERYGAVGDLAAIDGGVSADPSRLYGPRKEASRIGLPVHLVITGKGRRFHRSRKDFRCGAPPQGFPYFCLTGSERAPRRDRIGVARLAFVLEYVVVPERSKSEA